MSNDRRIRELERAASTGGAGAQERLEAARLRSGLPARYPFARDRLLQQSGNAGIYYARQLLGMIPPEWREKGAEVPLGVHERRCELLDGSDHLMLVRNREPQASARRPSVCLNLPDGVGNPRVFQHAEGGHYGFGYCQGGEQCPGHTSNGILLIAYCSLSRSWPYVSNGGVEIEVRVGGVATTNSQRTWNQKLRAGWRNGTFLRWVELLYNSGSGLMETWAPTALTVRRYRELRDVWVASMLARQPVRTIDVENGLRRAFDAEVTSRGQELGLQPIYLGHVTHGDLLAPEQGAAWRAMLDEWARTDPVFRGTSAGDEGDQPG